MNTQLRNLLFYFCIGLNILKIHGMYDDDIEAQLVKVPLLIDENKDEEGKFSLELLGKLPWELSMEIFSFIPPYDVGLSNFLRYIQLIEQPPFSIIAQQLKNCHHDYIMRKLQPKNDKDENARETVNEGRKKSLGIEGLAKSMLSFMATTKNNNYSWNEGYLLNKLIPLNKKKINFPPCRTIKHATEHYVQEILNELAAINHNTYLAQRYIDLHRKILGIFLERLRVYYNFITVDEVVLSCNKYRCNLGSVDLSDLNCYPVMIGAGAMASIFSALWFFFTPMSWYALAFGCPGLGCIATPLLLKKRIIDENRKNKGTYKKIDKAISLIQFHLIKSLPENLKAIRYNTSKKIHKHHHESREEVCGDPVINESP